MHEPGRVEKQALDLPAGIEVEPIPSDRTLVDLLLTGEIDALYALRTPRPMLAGGTQIRWLFADAGPRRSATPPRPGSSRSCTPSCSGERCTRPGTGLRAPLYTAFERANALTEARMGEVAAQTHPGRAVRPRDACEPRDLSVT
jgi:4,5-dihydroxyphthalate decarboxylase